MNKKQEMQNEWNNSYNRGGEPVFLSTRRNSTFY